MKIKRILSFALVIISVFLLASCTFNPDKEDLSQYVLLGDFTDITYDYIKTKYNEYREYYASLSDAVSLKNGDIVDIKLELFQNEDDILYDYSGEYSVGLHDNKEFRLFDKTLTYDSNKISDYVWNLENLEKLRTITIGESFTLERDIFGDVTVPVITPPDGKDVNYVNLLIKSFFTLDLDKNEGISNDDSYKLRITINKRIPTGQYYYGGEYDYSDDDIADFLESFIKSYDSINKQIEDGDYVLISYEGKLKTSGETFDGNKGENVMCRVGDGYYWNSFEKQLLGHKEGDKFDITIKIPDEIENEKVSGKEVVYNVEINGVYDVNSLVLSNTSFTTVGELKYALRVYLYAQYNIMDMLDEKSRILYYPNNMIEQYRKISEKYVYANLDAFCVEQYQYSGVMYTREQAFSYMYGSSYSSISDFIAKAAEVEMKKVLVAYATKKALNIEYTNNDYIEDLKDQVLYESLSDGVTYTEKDIENKYDRDRLKGLFVRDKCTQYLLDNLNGMPVLPNIDK